MAHVTVSIAGRNYRMACDEGQEEHLTRLAAEVDSRIDGLRRSFGEIGDQRLSVMAAITIADELAETRRRLATLERDLADQRAARATALARLEQTERSVAQAVNAAAARLEQLSLDLGPAPEQRIGLG
ncbi:cell division protein ZapA [Ancylobacter sp. 6x-1]|uniref:Cell division protein ZapA n=1 Tax=Ancylobacter crimeensis TaxID=2579147 RepID=A0ABT0DEJ8_9HYPH|nr:cell division protein ZapA [Ancylobacter crimeensis]MCK0198294.1 cell division protein ZapA [Ancylobacter crimeensis]